METFSTSRQRHELARSELLRRVRPPTMLRERIRPTSPYGRPGEGDDAEREVEREPDEAATKTSEERRRRGRRARSGAVGANLLLERHAANDTSGGAVSPSAEKNSRARNPSGRGQQQPGNVWMAVLYARRWRCSTGAPRDLVLRVGQLRLEPEEVLRRLQVRVRLGDGEEPAEGRRSASFAAAAAPGDEACAIAARARVTSSKTPRSWAA